MGKRTEVLGLLRERNFRLLWFGETVSSGGSSMAAVLVPLLAVTTLHASTFSVAALTAASYLPWLIIGLPAGAWVDRLPVRPLMIGCDVVAAALYASLPVLAWLGLLSIGDVLVIALLAGGANVLFATAYQVYLPSLVSGADLMEGNAKLQGSASMATIGGRGVAGMAAEGLGAAPAVLFNAASFLVSAACLLGIRRTPPERTAPARTSLRAEIGQGARLIARDRSLRSITLYAAAGNLTYSGYNALLVVFLVKVAGFTAATTGLLLSTVGVGGLAGALIARRIGGRLGTPRAMQLTALITGAFALLIPLTRTGPAVTCYIAGAFMVSSRLAGRQHPGRLLPAGLLPAGDAGPGGGEHAFCRLGDDTAGRVAGWCARYHAGRADRPVGAAWRLCPVRLDTAGNAGSGGSTTACYDRRQGAPEDVVFIGHHVRCEVPPEVAADVARDRPPGRSGRRPARRRASATASVSAVRQRRVRMPSR